MPPYTKKVRSKSAVVRKATKDGKTVHFANLMDLCHLKDAELAKHLQKIQEASCALEEKTSKTKKDTRAVFTEQGALASQMAAAKFLDTISKLLDMAGETSDAISAYTLVKMTEAPRFVATAKKKNVLRFGSEFLHDKDQKYGVILKNL